MQRLQVELIGGLRRHELHRRALHRLGDRLRVADSATGGISGHALDSPAWPSLTPSGLLRPAPKALDFPPICDLTAMSKVGRQVSATRAHASMSRGMRGWSIVLH